jgi:hypothetical protein
VANVVEIIVTGKNLTKPEFEAAARDARGLGQKTGENFTTGIGEQVKQELPAKVEAPLEDSGRRGGEKSGKAAGEGFNVGMAPLILGAFTAAAAVGPAAILGGMATAVVGLGALILRSNADIQAEYKTLAGDVSSVMQSAVAPLAPAIQAAMVTADESISRIGPELAKIFTDVTPDVGQLATGIEQLVSHALPGIEAGLNGSRGMVADLSGSLAGLGDNIGRTFSNLTENSQQTGRALANVVDLVGNLTATLGKLTGDLAATGAGLVNGLVPALDGVLHAVQAISSPALVGGVVGAFGAMKLDPAISGGLTKASEGLLSVGAKAEEAGGLVGKFSGAALKSAGALSTAADVMGGPWGIAIGAGIGLLGGLIGSMDKTIATASDFTAAIAADNGAVGANTTAIIQQKLASVDLSGVMKDLGVSQATLIEYAAGEAGAQKTVTDAYNAKTTALDKTAGSVEHYGKVNSVTNNQSQIELNTLAQTKSKIDQVTAAVADAIAQQNAQSQAYLAATKSAGIFAGMVDTATTALQTQATQAGITTVASLQLGGGQDQLSQDLANTVTQYQLAAAGASGYNTVLSALNGTTNTLLSTEAGFTVALDGVTTAVKSNGDSLDVNNDKGAKNIQTFTQIASAAQKAADAVYQNEVQTKGATTAYNDANAKLAAEKQAFIDAAEKAGFNKDAVKALADELYQLPPNITVNADVSPALQDLNGLIQRIDNSSGTVQIYGSTGGRALGAQAHGGVVGGIGSAASGGVRGALTLVGEQGPEIVDLPFGATVRSNPDSMAALAGGAGRGGGGVLQLEWVGNSADPLFQLLRNGIRVKYGSDPKSVQKALGQTF